MFCVPSHHQLHQPASIFIPTAYEHQTVASMMMSVLPSRQTVMTNFQPASVPPLPSSLTICDFQQRTPPTPSRPTYDELSPVKLKATGQRQVRGTTVSSSGSKVTSFRIADILDWRVGSSGRRVYPRSSLATSLDNMSPSEMRFIVRPWDQRRSSASLSSASLSELEERNVDVDDDVIEIDVDDASCSLPGTTSSDATSDRDVCPLGALLRMTNQTNFDECANRLQECFTDGRYSCMCRINMGRSNGGNLVSYSYFSIDL